MRRFLLVAITCARFIAVYYSSGVVIVADCSGRLRRRACGMEASRPDRRRRNPFRPVSECQESSGRRPLRAWRDAAFHLLEASVFPFGFAVCGGALGPLRGPNMGGAAAIWVGWGSPSGQYWNSGTPFTRTVTGTLRLCLFVIGNPSFSFQG